MADKQQSHADDENDAKEAQPKPAEPTSRRFDDRGAIALGDSYIAGEAGRWKGNESEATKDAPGDDEEQE